MRRRYEVFLGGRLLRTTDMHFLSGMTSRYSNPGDTGDPADWMDGRSWWTIDGSDVADDVARAMFVRAGEEYPHGETRPQR